MGCVRGLNNRMGSGRRLLEVCRVGGSKRPHRGPGWTLDWFSDRRGARWGKAESEVEAAVACTQVHPCLRVEVGKSSRGALPPGPTASVLHMDEKHGVIRAAGPLKAARAVPRQMGWDSDVIEGGGMADVAGWAPRGVGEGEGAGLRPQRVLVPLVGAPLLRFVPGLLNHEVEVAHGVTRMARWGERGQLGEDAQAVVGGR